MRKLAIALLILIWACPLSAQKENWTTGKEGAYVGRVLATVTMTFPQEVLGQLTPEQKASLTGVEVQKDRIVGQALPFGGYARLGDLMCMVDREGYFSFNSIPPGVVEGQFFQQIIDTKPVGSFPVSKLVKQGSPIDPIILHFTKDVKDHLDAME